jgi:NAD-dependent deacetylase
MDLTRFSGFLQESSALLKNAKYAVALTGAGSSTPSGIPDFRSEGIGLWTRYSPNEVASLTAFRRNPERFYKWLRPLIGQMLVAEPNPGHFALAELEKRDFLNAIITQNFDGLHQRAGSMNVLQVHGSMNTLTCIGCYQQVNADEFTQPLMNDGTIPHCEFCNNILKPDVVLFGEQLPTQIWTKARQVTQACDVMIVAGTSLVVYPVAQLPELAKKNGARIIIVNKTSTYMDEFADVVLPGDVAEILPEIITLIDNE